MGFIKRFKHIVSGRIAKSNRLIGNHGLRICNKIKDSSSFINSLTVGIAICSIEFLEEIIFDLEDLKYKDGIDINPFKENIKRLDEINSFEMFKLVAGNYLARLIGEGYFDRTVDFIDLTIIKDKFFEIYEFNDEDIKIFDNLVKLAQKQERPTPEIRLYYLIFERAYNIKPPETLQMMNFEIIFKSSFNEVFMPSLLKIMENCKSVF